MKEVTSPRWPCVFFNMALFASDELLEENFGRLGYALSFHFREDLTWNDCEKCNRVHVDI